MKLAVGITPFGGYVLALTHCQNVAPAAALGPKKPLA